MAWYAPPRIPPTIYRPHSITSRSNNTYISLRHTGIHRLTLHKHRSCHTKNPSHSLHPPPPKRTPPQNKERTPLPLHGQKTTPVVEGHSSASINYTNRLYTILRGLLHCSTTMLTQFKRRQKPTNINHAAPNYKIAAIASPGLLRTHRPRHFKRRVSNAKNHHPSNLHKLQSSAHLTLIPQCKKTPLKKGQPQTPQ